MKMLVIAAAMLATIPLADQRNGVPPANHLNNDMVAASRIQRLDRNGNPTPEGSIAFVSIVNGESPSDAIYDHVRDYDLAPHGLTEAQVQVAWVRQSDDADASRLEAELGDTVRAMRTRYPNLQIVYLSSRSPQAVQWLVQAQASQMQVSGIVVGSRAGVLRYPDASPWIVGL